MKMITCKQDSFHEHFQKHKPSQMWHKNLHSEKSGISLGLPDFYCAESRKPKIEFEVLEKQRPFSLLPSTGTPGINFNSLCLSLIIRYWRMHGSRTNLRGRNLKLMIKKMIGHCRRKGKKQDSKNLKLRGTKNISKWMDWEQKVSRQWWEKKDKAEDCIQCPRAIACCCLSCCTVQQILVFILPCSHREPGLWQPFQSYLGKQFYRTSLEAISQTNSHCEDCPIQISSLSLS